VAILTAERKREKQKRAYASFEKGEKGTSNQGGRKKRGTAPTVCQVRSERRFIPPEEKKEIT